MFANFNWSRIGGKGLGIRISRVGKPDSAAGIGQRLCLTLSAFRVYQHYLGNIKQKGESMDDKKVIFSMVGVNKTYPPNHVVIKDISLSFYYGAKIGILGLNGSGKSTLLKIIAGSETEFNGDLHLSEGYSVGLLLQEPILDESKTVLEVVKEGAGEVVALLQEFDIINDKFAEEMTDDEMTKLLARQAVVQDELDRLDAWSLEDKLGYAMEALRCPEPDAPIKHLSGGERRRVALCRLLIQKPDILLLDEPTNHLDAESVSWLERHLQEYKGTILAVTHDRYFLDNVAQWILELDRGKGVPWKGNYTSWLEQKQKRLQQEKKSEDKRLTTLARELEWIRMTPKAKHVKSKSRIAAYNDLFSQETERTVKDLELYIPSGNRLGDLVIEATNIGKRFGEKVLFNDLSFRLPAGGIVGVIGGNGAGKTTLFKLLSGIEKLDSGELKVGSSVELGYMDQSRSELDGSKTVWELISGSCEFINMGKVEVNSRAYVSRFNFNGLDQQKKVDCLSGGERNRVQLALLLKQGSNLLLLDEPTNDLDINTLRSLEEALMNFAGCAVVISHDRWFLDRIATHILAFEGDSQAVWFDGNYSEYEKDLKARLGSNLAPKRIRYQGLTRG